MKFLWRGMITIFTLAAFTCPGDTRVHSLLLLVRPEHRYAELDDAQATTTLLRGVYAVGDSSDIPALAYVGNDYRNPAYSSVTQPDGFVFASTAPDVASVVAPGIIMTRAPGESRVSVMHGGLIDTLRLVVLPRLSSLRITLPETLRVGDQVTATLAGFDGAAREVPRVYAYVESNQPSVISTREGSLSIVARTPGTVRISARVVGQDIRTTTTLTVTP